uniref:Uncharacterized protein n=1 Tax=Anguilla anguilla TaxID=7936 RepID=A0A0E9TWF5_ANGAN
MKNSIPLQAATPVSMGRFFARQIKGMCSKQHHATKNYIRADEDRLDHIKHF